MKKVENKFDIRNRFTYLTNTPITTMSTPEKKQLTPEEIEWEIWESELIQADHGFDPDPDNDWKSE